MHKLFYKHSSFAKRLLALLLAVVWAGTFVPCNPLFAQEELVALENTGQETTGKQEVIDTNFMFMGEEPKSIKQLRFMENHFANLAEKVFPATVNIQMGAAQGTGVVVSSEGHILTAAHVIAGDAKEAKITFMAPDGTRGRQVRAKPLGVDRGIDSGMLKISPGQGNDFPYLDIGLSNDLVDGQWVMAVGHPGGLNVKRGLVVRVGRLVYRSDKVLKTDCTLVGGDSGGPLVDMNGEVIGIHSRIGQRLLDNLHVPVNTFTDQWDRLAQGIVIDGKPTMGFSVLEDTNKILSIADKGSAQKAGLKKDDILIKIDDVEIKNRDDIRKAILELDLRPQMTVDVVVTRKGRSKKVELTVGEKAKAQ